MKIILKNKSHNTKYLIKKLFIKLLFTILIISLHSFSYAEVILRKGRIPNGLSMINCQTALNMGINNIERLRFVRKKVLLNSLRLFSQKEAFSYLGENKNEWKHSNQRSFKQFQGYTIDEQAVGCSQTMLNRWASLELMNDYNIGYLDLIAWDPEFYNGERYDTVSYFIQIVSDFYTKSKEDQLEVKSAISQELKGNPEIQQYLLDKLDLNE